MNRFTRDDRQRDQLQYSAWLVADSDGGLRMVRGQPDVGRGEVGVALTVAVPKSLFRKPLLKATVIVPPQAGVTEGEAIQAVVDVISAGCDFDVDVVGAS